MPNGIEDIAALLPRAPQQGPLKDYGQIQQGINQNNESVQRQQAAAMAIQQAKRDQRDQEILQRAITEGGGDWDKTIKTAVSSGLSPKGYYGIQDQRIKLRKAGADADSEETKAALEKMKLVGSKAGAYLSLPLDAQARNEADLRQALGIPENQPIDLDKVRLAANSSMLYGDQMEQGRKQADAARAQQKFDTEQPALAAEASTRTAVANRTAQDPGLLPPTARATADQAAATQAALAADRATDNARQAQQLDLTRRGQDVSAATQRRGQDMTDARAKGGGKPLPAPAMAKLDTKAQVYDSAKRLEESFQDKFAGHTIIGGLGNVYGGVMGDDSGQTQWWEYAQTYINDVRHGKFGGALTSTEKAEFEKEVRTLTPRSDPSEVKKTLGRITDIAHRNLKRDVEVYGKGGYNPEQLSEYDPGERPASTRSAPKIGAIEDGHVYMGGDPSSEKKSWKKVK